MLREKRYTHTTPDRPLRGAGTRNVKTLYEISIWGNYRKCKYKGALPMCAESKMGRYPGRPIQVLENHHFLSIENRHEGTQKVSSGAKHINARTLCFDRNLDFVENIYGRRGKAFLLVADKTNNNKRVTCFCIYKTQ